MARQYRQRGKDLWKKEVFQSCTAAPDFSVHMIEKRFAVIRKYAPFAFADLTQVDRDPWMMLQPVVSAFNENRRRTIRHSGVLVEDESMSAWKPRASRLGGLPNISFIARKPKPLGTEFKSIADGLSRVMLHLEIQMGRKVMPSKKYSKALGATAGCCVRMAEAVLGL